MLTTFVRVRLVISSTVFSLRSLDVANSYSSVTVSFRHPTIFIIIFRVSSVLAVKNFKGSTVVIVMVSVPISANVIDFILISMHEVWCEAVSP